MVVSLSLSKTGRRLKVDDGCQSELVEDGSKVESRRFKVESLYVIGDDPSSLCMSA